MLNSLLQNIGQRLAKKPFTWMSWWRGKRWISVFCIIPPLSEACPLWKRDETSLRSLRLFGLEPQVLHAELQHYWKRPFWQRWWLGLFTAIHHQRKAYAYYQRCLVFSEVRKQQGHTDSVFSLGQERALLLDLVAWFDCDIKHGEKILEQHAGDLNWLPSRFKSILSQYEQKREREFLKRLEKKIKKLPTVRIRNSVRSRIKKEYQGLRKLMRDYLLSGLSPAKQASTYNDQASASSGAYEATEDSVVSDNQELVYVGPAALTTRNTLGMYPTGKAHLDDIASVGDWVSLQGDVIASLLEKGRPEAYIEIKGLLGQSLNSIRMLIEPQIACYQELIKKVRQGKVEYQVAIEYSEVLQPRLMKFFRSSALLFHPDKSGQDEDLIRIKTELFKEFKQLSDASLEIINAGLQTLKKCIPKWKLAYQAILEQMKRDREAFKVRMEKEMKEIGELEAESDALLKEVIEESRQARERMKQYREEMRKSREEMEQDLKEIREQITGVKNNFLAQNLEMNENPTLEEKPGSSLDFFTRPAP